MTRDEKHQVIEDLKNVFQQNTSVLLLTFSEITVPDLTELRRKLKEEGSSYRVVKNTLAIRAAEETPVGQVSSYFEGPTAVAFSGGDPAGLAKALKEFVKSHPGFNFKAGVVEGQSVESNQIEDLAEMPSRDELLSKLAYLFNAPLTRFASTLQSPLTNLGVLLKQVSENSQEQ